MEGLACCRLRSCGVSSIRSCFLGRSLLPSCGTLSTRSCFLGRPLPVATAAVAKAAPVGVLGGTVEEAAGVEVATVDEIEAGSVRFVGTFDEAVVPTSPEFAVTELEWLVDPHLPSRQ